LTDFSSIGRAQETRILFGTKSLLAQAVQNCITVPNRRSMSLSKNEIIYDYFFCNQALQTNPLFRFVAG